MIRNTAGEALVLVHRRELKQQHMALFKSLGITNARVETYQTERNRMNQHDTPRLLIVDEAHLSRSNTWSEIVEHYNTWTVGLTATPVRLDGKPLCPMYTAMVQDITVKELIAQKRLAPFEYYAPVNVDVENLRIQAGDFVVKDLEKIMCDRAIYSDVLRSWERIAKDQKTIAYCVSVSHARETADMFCGAGYPAQAIDSSTPEKQRDRIMQDFRDGKIMVLCNVGIISEGVSIDDVTCTLLLRPTDSHALYWQQAMRCMRYLPGKTATIIDCVGNYTRNPMPDEDVTWSLDTTATKPKRMNQQGDFRIRTCAQCYMVFPTAAECPYCGAEYALDKREIEAHRDIELSRITEEAKLEIEKRKKQMRSEVGRCKTFQDLLAIQKQRGYKSGWAFRMARAKGIKIQ